VQRATFYLWLRASAMRIFLSLAAVASANAEMLNPGNKELGETIATRNFCLWLRASAMRIFLSLAVGQCNAEISKSRRKRASSISSTCQYKPASNVTVSAGMVGYRWAMVSLAGGQCSAYLLSLRRVSASRRPT